MSGNMFLLALLIFQNGLINKVVLSESLLEVVYWELKPYIFTNEEGQLDGIIPMMLEEAQHYCGNKTNATLSRYVLKEKSRKSFYDLVRSNTSYGTGQLENITHSKSFWVPVVANKDRKNKEFERSKGLRSYQLVKSEHVAVITSRSVISLPTKIIKGIMSCKQIFVLAFLLSLIISMIMWLFEHTSNEGFPNSFITGTGCALWWSFVSMTTVGYGDIVPKTPVGRSIAVIWLFIGVMIACVMTATMTDVVSGGGSFELQGQKMAVLTNSYEEKLAKELYRAEIISVSSYDEAVQMVNRGNAYAAVINADIVAWYQDEFYNDTSDNPLRVIELIPANVYINCYSAAEISPALKIAFECMYKQKEEVYQKSIENFKRYCKKEVLYIDSMSDFIQRNNFIQVLIWMITGMLAIGIIYEIYRYFNRERDEKKTANKRECICKELLVRENRVEV